MRTEDLISLLARGAGPAPRAVVARRVGPAAGVGLGLALLGSSLVPGWVPASTWAGCAPWFKLGYALAMAVGAAWLVARLARPGAAARAPALAVAGVAALTALVGVAAWAATPDGARLAGLLGHSAAACPWFVLALSLPALAGLLWALRGLAPTRPRAAGLAAGLLAGAIGAGGYALACTELALSFVAAWYPAGVLMAGLLGAALGPRWLRW